MDFSNIVSGWGGIFLNQLMLSFKPVNWEWLREALIMVNSGHDLRKRSPWLGSGSTYYFMIDSTTKVGDTSMIFIDWVTKSGTLKICLVSNEDGMTIQNHRIDAEADSTFNLLVSDCFEMAKAKNLIKKETNMANGTDDLGLKLSESHFIGEEIMTFAGRLCQKGAVTKDDLADFVKDLNERVVKLSKLSNSLREEYLV